MTKFKPRDLDAVARKRFGPAYLIHLLRNSCYAKQLEVIDDPSMQIAFCCTRRTGKSELMCRAMLIECFRTPNTKCVYVGDTFQHAKRVAWTPILLKINKELGLGGVHREGDALITFPNGSTIQLIGAANTSEAHAKLKGQKFKLVCIDEAQDFPAMLSQLCYDTVGPMLADTPGSRVMLAGTPSNNRRFFYAVTGNQSEDNFHPEPGWSVHRWTANENPHIDWAGYIEKLLRDNPGKEHSAGFRQNCLGIWDFDETLLCFPGFTVGKNVTVVPQLSFNDKWTYVMAMDLGFNDSTALLVLGYSSKAKHLHVFECWKETKQTIQQINAKVMEFERSYKITHFVGDSGGGGKQIIASMKVMTGHNWKPAEKQGDKAGNIGLVNDDFNNLVLTVDPRCQKLIKELQELSWDRKLLEDRGKREVSGMSDDHAIDALRYGWRVCQHHRAKADKVFDILSVPLHLREQVTKPSLKEAMARIERTNDKEANGYQWEPD